MPALSGKQVLPTDRSEPAGACGSADGGWQLCTKVVMEITISNTDRFGYWNEPGERHGKGDSAGVD